MLLLPVPVPAPQYFRHMPVMSAGYFIRAALAAYEEREMPRLKKENPGLRYTQLNELLFKNFQKSPENPFNQANIIQYNSSREEQKNLIETTIKNVEDRLRI
ncbi:1122_t:CDS:2 [Entrophospora sp. SA101]|nr:1122_t:CDS:2 [Entrophospora sp. SA101]